MHFIITFMLLELKVPHGTTFHTSLPLVPVRLRYVLSFIYAGRYWNKLQYGCSSLGNPIPNSAGDHLLLFGPDDFTLMPISLIACSAIGLALTTLVVWSTPPISAPPFGTVTKTLAFPRLLAKRAV